MRAPRWTGLLLATLPLLTAWARKPIRLFLVGDSTMALKQAPHRPETGWGEMLQQYFDADEVRVEDYARNGRSSRSFIAEKRWQEVLDQVQEGDWVFIQFGHNDEPKGGANPRFTPPAEFEANLLRFVSDVRAKNANPVLMTPVARRRFDDAGKLEDTHGEYPELVRNAARAAAVPVIDMTESTGAIVSCYGPEASRALFVQLPPGANPNYPSGVEDNTHYSLLGAQLAARAAVQAIRQQRLELASHLKLAVEDTTPPSCKASGSR